ncbi:MAG: energy transducer TonB [Planctomycetes bacterium]|nr:energy transducer TonB [Planctomycetota bacterium]
MPTIRRSYWAAGVGVSLAFHVGVACAAVVLHALFRPAGALPIEAGPNSMALMASMASAGNADRGEQEAIDITLPTELPPDRETVAPELAPELHLARHSRVRDLTRLSSPSETTREPTSDVPVAMLTPVLERVESGGDPTMNSEQDVTLPRAIVEPLLKIEQVSSAVRSDPSPSSDPIAGADIDRQPSPLYNPSPAYPTDARRVRAVGTVLLSVTVAATGTVKAATVLESSGNESLDAAALDVIWRWRFRPALRHGQPIDHTIGVPIRFRLAE